MKDRNVHGFLPQPSCNARPNAFLSPSLILSLSLTFTHTETLSFRLSGIKLIFLFLVEPGSTTTTLEGIQLLGRLDLCARFLSANGQAHGVATTTVRAHVTQALDVLLDDAAGVVLDGHVGQLGSQGRHRLGRDGPHARERVDCVFGHDARRGLASEAVEGLEGFLMVLRVRG